MKADRLVRKTHFKKLNGSSFSDVLLHDLTEKKAEVTETGAFSLVSLVAEDMLSFEQISLLPDEFKEEEDILFWAGSVVSHSPLARQLWQDAEEKGWSIGLSDLGSDGFYIDVPSKIIWLDHFSLTPDMLGRSTYFRNVLLTTTIRALRDVWHENRVGAFEQRYNPETVLMMERVRAADSDTVTILSVWELRSAGFSDIWRHLLGSEEGDMAMVFTRVLERQPTALYDGLVLAQTFYQWFEDEDRVDGTDHDTLEALDDLLLSSRTHNPFGQIRLQPHHIEALSKLPDGTSYLDGLGEAIMEDPFFAGLGDPVNQTHLFHLMYDLETFTVNNVPFRDRSLARKIFPDGEITSR